MKPTRTLQARINPNESTGAHARLAQLTLVAVILLMVPSLAGAAGTWTAFGPQTFVRGSGSPTMVTVSYSVQNPNTLYVLRVNNGGVNGELPRSTGIVTVNGTRIFGPLLLNPVIPVLELPVLLRTNNQIGVQLQGTTGSGIAVEVIGFDLQPPAISASISPAPNAAGWNNSNATVSFICSDQTSGVASCPSPVVVTTEGANQVISGTATDKAGNKATVSVKVNLDKTPPLITPSVNPPPDAGGWNLPPVTVSYICSDQLSGIATCSSPVTLTMEGPGQSATGIATDLAGNTATVQQTVNISTSFFLIRNYAGKCLDYGQNTEAGGAGVFLNDCAASHPIRVEEINNRHEVLLHAGASVIGIHKPVPPTIGIAPPPQLSEFPLELQSYDPALAADQVFALDGDSIIMASSRPCYNADSALCPPPPPPPALVPPLSSPPQLVVQIQNARGANGSPLVASTRKLADSEFWDFNALDGSPLPPKRAPACATLTIPCAPSRPFKPFPLPSARAR